MVLQNRTDRDIADELGVEELAIRREVEHLVQRLGYSNRDAFTRTLPETHPDWLEPGLLNSQETFPRRSNSWQRGRPEDFDALWMFGELA